MTIHSVPNLASAGSTRQPSGASPDKRTAILEAATLESLERGTDVSGWYVTLHVPDLELLDWVQKHNGLELG